MSAQEPNLLIDARIRLLKTFKSDLERWFNGDFDQHDKSQLRSRINSNVIAAKNAVRDAGTQKRLTVAPPPAVGGIVAQNIDPFDDPFQDFWGYSVIPTVIDSVEQAIGVYEHAKTEEGLVTLSSRETIDIEAAIERALRPAFRSCRPTKERDVQDAIENIFQAIGVDYLREQEVAPVGPKVFRPDFIIEGLDLAIEVKIATKSHGVKEIQEEMNADISAYKTKWKRILFITYDADGMIADPHQFRRENMRLFGVSVVVVKH